MTSPAHDPVNAHALERLVFFSDAVFAIVITLLVIEIEQPDLNWDATRTMWLQALADLLPSFGAFLLSFMVIGAFWMSHHSLFLLVRRYDERLLWPNLILLLTVAFLPFRTSLMATGSLDSLPFAFYAASLLAAGLAKARLVRIALSPDLLANDASASAVKQEMRQRLIMPIASGVTLLLAFVTVPWNTWAMFLVPLLKRLPWFTPTKGNLADD